MKNTLLISLMIAAGITACSREEAGTQGNPGPGAQRESAPATGQAGGTSSEGAASPTKPSPTTNTPGAMGEIAPTAPNAEPMTRHPGAGAAATGSGAPNDAMSETERKTREQTSRPPAAGSNNNNSGKKME